jgi:hypothetical protein
VEYILLGVGVEAIVCFWVGIVLMVEAPPFGGSIGLDLPRECHLLARGNRHVLHIVPKDPVAMPKDSKVLSPRAVFANVRVSAGREALEPPESQSLANMLLQPRRICLRLFRMASDPRSLFDIQGYPTHSEHKTEQPQTPEQPKPCVIHFDRLAHGWS